MNNLVCFTLSHPYLLTWTLETRANPNPNPNPTSNPNPTLNDYVLVIKCLIIGT